MAGLGLVAGGAGRVDRGIIEPDNRGESRFTDSRRPSAGPWLQATPMRPGLSLDAKAKTLRRAFTFKEGRMDWILGDRSDIYVLVGGGSIVGIRRLVSDDVWFALVEALAPTAQKILDREAEMEREREQRDRESQAEYRLRRLMRIGRGSVVCVGCGSVDHASMQVDHITPKCRGGSNRLENLQLLCSKCNASKGARTMEEWRAAQAVKA